MSVRIYMTFRAVSLQWNAQRRQLATVRTHTDRCRRKRVKSP